MKETKQTGRRATASSRQQNILAAALKVFAKKGFNGTTTKEIAAEAGVAEGTIFRYFKTKKDILLSLMGPYVVQTLVETIDGVSGATDEVKLTVILKNRLELISNNIDLFRLLITEAQFQPELRDKFAELIAMKAATVLEEFISKRIAEGVYRELNPQILSRAFVGMAGIFVLWKEFLHADKYVSFDQDEVVKSIVEIFLNGVKKSESGEESTL